MVPVPILFFFLAIPLSHALCISADPPGPLLVSLTNGQASLTLNLTLCPADALFLSARPAQLTPSFSLQPLVNTSDGCQTVRADLNFQFTIGAGKLVLKTRECTLRIPIVVSGIVAYNLPSGDVITSNEAEPVPIPAPVRKSTRVFLDVRAVLSTGGNLRDRKAAEVLEVNLIPAIENVTASIIRSNNKGNLLLESVDAGSNAPRAQINQTIELRLEGSDITTQIPIAHAPLTATVLAVRAPAKLSPLGGEEITLVVRRADAEQRRLVITNTTIEESEYVQSGDNYLSSYISPPLRWGKHEWRMEFRNRDNFSVAEDVSGHVFNVASRPILNSLRPAIVKPDTNGFIVVSGAFDDSALLYVDDEPYPTRDIVYRAFGEIIMRIPRIPSASTTSVSVFLKTKRGKKSNPLDLTFDLHAIFVDAVALRASANPRKGRFEIPILCNRSEVPLVFARADLSEGVYELPTYSFTIRSSTSKPDFEELSNGPDGMVALDPELFGEEPELAKDFVSVRIQVTQGEQSGEAFVFISRLLRRDVIGVTVLPPLESQRTNGRDILRAHVTSLIHCENATNFDMKTLWSINRRVIISSELENEEEFEGMDSALAVGLGRTLVVSDDDPFSVSATVEVTDRSTRKTIARGISRKHTRLGVLVPRLTAFINGGLRSLTLQTGMDFYEIIGSVFEVDGTVPTSDAQYFWDCQALSSKKSKCPAALFPPNLRRRRSIAKFNVTTNSLEEKLTIEYSLTVRLEDRESGLVRLRLTVSSSESAVFPLSNLSAGATLPQVLSNGLIRFSCYQHIIVTILSFPESDTYSFRLFRTDNDSDILETSADEVLISHSGYWSPQNRDRVLFGIQGDKLEPGNYTLYGSHDEKFSEGTDTSWAFEVERCHRLVAYTPSLSSGTSGETIFVAGASSVPPSSNLFFFALVKSEDDAPNIESTAESIAYIRGCSGSQICSFSVPDTGRYFIRVDMYDSSGSRRLSSAIIERPITVVEPNSIRTEAGSRRNDSRIYAETVRAALLQEDETAFLDGVLQLQGALDNSLLDDIIEALQEMGSSPILVPKFGSSIVSTCTHLIGFEEVHHNSERIDRICSIVEDTIIGSVTNEGPGTALTDSATRFYSVLLQETSNFSGTLPDGRDITSSMDISDKPRQSAATHLPLILAVGRECGFTDQMVVTYPSQTRVNVSEGTPLVALNDDYRIAVSCYRGQVPPLLPEPISAELCTKAENDTRLLPYSKILVSVEQYNLSSGASQTGLLSGPTIQTKITRLKKVNDSVILQEDRESNSTCYRTRISVDVPKQLAEDLIKSASEQRGISCDPDELFASSIDVRTRDGSSKKSQPKEFTIGADGRVGTIFEATPPVQARMTVNGTQLRQCVVTARLEGRGKSTVSIVLLSLLGIVGFFVLVIIIVLCLRRRKPRDSFSVPESVAPWDSFEMSQSRTRSTLTSNYFNSGEVNRAGSGRVQNEWTGQYRQMHYLGNGNNTRTGGVNEGGEVRKNDVSGPRSAAGSALDQWERFSGSRVSSMLTATDSYTTSSGDLSSFGLSSRLRLQTLNALPGVDSAQGPPYPKAQP